MHRMFVLGVLSCLVLGCASSSKDPSGSKDKAVRCARAWRAKGFDFDPDTMTCEQMYARAQALRNAAYWEKRGYVFDAGSMTARKWIAKPLSCGGEEFGNTAIRVWPAAMSPRSQENEAGPRATFGSSGWRRPP